jgi:hypothetical protein
LLHLSFGFEEYGAVFCAVVGFTIVINAVQSLVCVWTLASAWCAASLAILARPLVEGALISFLWRWAKKILLDFWWPAAIGIDIVHWFGITALVVIVVGWP